MNACAQIACAPPRGEVRVLCSVPVFSSVSLTRSFRLHSMPRTQWTRLRSKRQNLKTLLNQLLEYADAHAEDRKLWDSIMSFRTDLCQVQTAAWKELWQRRADRSETASTALFGVVRSVLEKLDAGTPTPEDIVSALLFAPFRSFSID